MKHCILVFICSIFFISSCRSPKDAAVKTAPVISAPDPEQPSAAAKTVGKVSHHYSAGGCACVIIISDPAKPSILIPKNKLPDNLDVDGLEISFNYHTLKMKQPAGCAQGIPADLTDITKK